MNRICLNCGREMDESDLGCGPGGTGCTYCTIMCPRCGQIVFNQDIIHDTEFGDYCNTYCGIEVDEEKRRKEESYSDECGDDFADSYDDLDFDDE